MSTESPRAAHENEPERTAAIRPWFFSIVLVMAALIAWLAWPSGQEATPYELSRTDGRPRFYATAYPEMQVPSNITPLQRLLWEWRRYQRHHGKPNPAAYTFPASPVRSCSIVGLLNQCMEVTGTRYLIAVEIAGEVEFGNTNRMNGTQWVAAFEHAVETSGPVVCYDWAKRRNFRDTLMLIHERPGLVKVVPRSKLTEYEKVGLVHGGSR